VKSSLSLSCGYDWSVAVAVSGQCLPQQVKHGDVFRRLPTSPSFLSPVNRARGSDLVQPVNEKGFANSHRGILEHVHYLPCECSYSHFLSLTLSRRIVGRRFDT